MRQKAIHFLQKEPTMWGPIFLLCTLALGVPFDLLFVAAIGLFLSARWQVRGCCYSLALLGITAVINHAFLVSDHLWQLGLEGSLACAFFITALAFEQGAAWIESLQSQMQTRKAALENLEEELAKTQERAQEQQIAFQEKVATLQKELEDFQSDHSSILILNEVLRKTTARHMQENEALTANALDLRRQKDLLQSEYAECQKELTCLAETDAMALQNTQLMKELNAARYEKEQTHLINETLARLYARESFKMKELDQEAASLADQLAAAHKEVRRIAQPLEETVAALRSEVSTLSFQFEKANLEANQVRTELLRFQEIQTERNFLRERLQAAIEEIALLQKQKPQLDPQVAEQLAFTQEKMMNLSQIEPLFKQLKKQFEEKNQVLYQTRTDLFKTDTELQKLRMEKAALELSPIPKEVEEEIHGLSAQILALEEENQQLQELVSILTENPQDAAKRKKKLKIPTSPEQELLF